MYLPLNFTVIQLLSLPLSDEGISQLLSSSEPSLSPHPSLPPDCCHTHSSPSFYFHSIWPVGALDFADSSQNYCPSFVSTTLSFPCSVEILKLLLQLKQSLDQPLHPFSIFLCNSSEDFVPNSIFFLLYNTFRGDLIYRHTFNLTIHRPPSLLHICLCHPH